MPKRKLALLALAATVVIALGANDSVARADTSQDGFQAKLQLTSSVPNTPTGGILNLVRPDLPSGKPKTETVGVFKLPAGTKINLGAVPPCNKDDTTLQIEGPYACPDSFIGAGFVTLYSGFGPPIDPIDFDQQWYYAPGQLVQLVTAHGTKMPVLKVLRANIKDATFTAELNDLPPGWPPGTTSAPKETDLTINHYVGPHGAFITTPPTCPASGFWTSTVTLYYADHTTDTLTDNARCQHAQAGRARRRTVKPRNHRRHRRHRRR